MGVVEWSAQGYEDGYLLVACDGIWEFLKEDQVADIVLPSLSKGATCDEVLQQLLEKARELWKEKEGTYCDDITAILFPLKTGPAPQLAGLGQESGAAQLDGNQS